MATSSWPTASRSTGPLPARNRGRTAFVVEGTAVVAVGDVVAGRVAGEDEGVGPAEPPSRAAPMATAVTTSAAATSPVTTRPRRPGRAAPADPTAAASPSSPSTSSSSSMARVPGAARPQAEQ
jgi:hypothetical protein